MKMKEKSSLVFTGDIGFDKYMDRKWNDDQLISTDVLSFLHSGDHVIANVEGALIDMDECKETSGIGQLIHAMNPAAADVLDRMHADIWNICNNHIMDAGETGIKETLHHALQHRAAVIGAGMNIEDAAKVLMLDEAGGIGIFSVGYRRGCKPADVDKAGCLLWNDIPRIRKNIDDIKKKCRWCVMVVHGGEEFTSLPSPYTRERYHQFLEMGADVIVAHHPHVPMNYETVNGKTIFYSLGNFIFDTDYQRAQYNTEFGLLVKLQFTAKDYSWQAVGIQIDRLQGRILKAPLPRIFTDVQEEEYQKLLPLAAKMMIAAYKRQLIYLNPQEYLHASEEKWRENFMNPRRSGRVENEALDFQVMYPLAKREDGEWKTSKLKDVAAYILEQMGTKSSE